MSSRVRTFARRATAGAIGMAGVTAAVAATSLISAAPASAATPGSVALQVAASKSGDPYEYGAAGPDAFDCSGLVQYSFRAAGVSLPRSAQDQYNATTHISQASKVPGDIIFFYDSSGAIYHDGIYAGNNAIWVAPKPGDDVQLETIWTSAYEVGRVGGAASAPSTVGATQVSYQVSSQPLLEYGSTGSSVAVVQRDLHITADGIFGPQTQAAVIAFQQAHGLLVDGIVGPQTWGALQRYTV